MPVGAASYGSGALMGQMMNPNSPFYRSNKIPENEKIIEMYRAVSPEEFDDIFSNNSFRGRMDGTTLQAKEFGNSFSETLDFANRSINSDKAAIIKVSIPESIYNKLNQMNLDPGIFKSGTPVVEPNMLYEFNKNIIDIKHVY